MSSKAKKISRIIREMDGEEPSNTPVESLDCELSVSIPMEKELIASDICKACVITIEGNELLVDLIMLDMHDFDIILGIDWLVKTLLTLIVIGRK